MRSIIESWPLLPTFFPRSQELGSIIDARRKKKILKNAGYWICHGYADMPSTQYLRACVLQIKLIKLYVHISIKKDMVFLNLAAMANSTQKLKLRRYIRVVFALAAGQFLMSLYTNMLTLQPNY